MRHSPWAIALVTVLWATQAQAQFQNKSIGLSAGYLNPLSTSPGSIAWTLPVGIYATYYLENNFDLVFELDGLIAHQSAPISQNIWGVNVTPIGVRYLFLQESFRPYVGLDASFLHFFGGTANLYGSSTSSSYVGVGPNAGFDAFLSDSLSIGLKLRYNLYIDLNNVSSAFDATARIATYF